MPDLRPRTIWFAVALVALSQGTVFAVRWAFEPRHVLAPKQELTALPMELGDWKGTVPEKGINGVDEKVFAVIGAQQAIDRIYTDPNGRTCRLHLALWTDVGERAPHPPEICYPSQGYTQETRTMVELPWHPDRSVRSTQFRRKIDGAEIVTMYWYQIGEQVYVDRNGSRRVFRDFWGSRERPPMVKVLMQTAQTNVKEDRAKLAELADKVYGFVTQL